MEITFVASVQGHQVERVREVAARLRRQYPGTKVAVVEDEPAKALLAKHKLNFGPAVIIDGRLEYVGIPRWGFLVERLAQVARRLDNPRTAAPPAPPPMPTAIPAKPAPAPVSPPAGTAAASQGTKSKPADA